MTVTVLATMALAAAAAQPVSKALDTHHWTPIRSHAKVCPAIYDPVVAITKPMLRLDGLVSPLEGTYSNACVASQHPANVAFRYEDVTRVSDWLGIPVADREQQCDGSREPVVGISFPKGQPREVVFDSLCEAAHDHTVVAYHR